MTKPSKQLTNLLSKAAIFSAVDIETEIVAVPEWGGSVRVSAMTGAMRDAWEAMLVSKAVKDAKDDKDDKAAKDAPAVKPDTGNARAKLVALSVVDEHGNLVFTPEDIAVLSKKSAFALDRIANVALRLSKLREQDLKEAVKN